MQDYNEIEKPTTEDFIAAAARGAMNLIPGGTFFDQYWATFLGMPMDRRRANWFQELYERVKYLEDHKDVNIALLQQDELFVDAVLRITALAQATLRQEKRQAFKNCLTNIALNLSPSETKVHLFIRLIDNLSVDHIKVLQLLNDPFKWFHERGLAMPYREASVIDLIDDGMNEVIEDSVKNLILRELDSNYLTQTSLSPNNKMLLTDAQQPKTTQLGVEFLDFITFDE